MFANELLKNKLCLQQQTQEKQINHLQESDRNEQVDFTFDSYIPKYNDDQNYWGTQQRMQNTTQSCQYIEHGMQQSQQGQQGCSELQILKNHILTIESIAIKEIQGLKKQLEQQKQEKQQFRKQLQNLKSMNKIESKESQNDKILDLIKQQNKMLKDALKKQLQINKNLIKDSLIAKKLKNIKPLIDQIENQDQSHQNQVDKENDPLSINLNQNLQYDSRQRMKMFNTDRPVIPLPGQSKKSLRI